MYFLVGLQESKLILDTTQQMVSFLQMIGFKDNELKTVIKYDGEHNEWFWRREFGDAFKWLFIN